jgi:O-acetyl-ADP-ribose deacetylase (regulator of RNase III)
MIQVITGDLMFATEKYIAHQANCVSTGEAGGIARVIFDKFPYADCYSSRLEKDVPGTIDIRGGEIARRVINMFSQYYPGSPRYPDSNLDGTLAREKYFHQCLLKVAKIPDLESIAFPWRIGCGIAGGVWAHYLGTLTNFAHYVENKKGVKVVIYQREGDE